METPEKDNRDLPACYTVIPANVRRDGALPPAAKLLYGEISALAGEKGCCRAGNRYFAEMYDTSEQTVINWIGILQDRGHILVEEEAQGRLIRLPDPRGERKKEKFPKEDASVNSNTAELKELLDLFDKEGLVISYLEADYFNHTFTFSLYPETVTGFAELIEHGDTYPLSINLSKTLENNGYKVVRYTSDRRDMRNSGFFLLSVEKTPDEKD
jgi:transposase